MRFTRGEVSKILDISSETLRYLEKKQIVAPNRDKMNNYRYYSEWDIYALYEYLLFRGLEFSTKEIVYYFLHDSLSDHIQHLEEKSRSFEEKAKWYQLLKENNDQHIQDVKAISKLPDYEYVKVPPYYYFIQSNLANFRKASSFNGLFENWKQYSSFLEPFLEIKMNGDDSFSYGWGFAVKEGLAEEFPIKTENAEKIGDELSLTFIVELDSSESFPLDSLEEGLFRIRDDGYEAGEVIFGRLLARTHEMDGYRRYVKIWIPIREAGSK